KVYSDNTQIQYAFAELPFVCPPSGRSRPGTGLISGSNVALNLGEILRGDRIVVSDYELQMGQDDEAHYLCSQKVDRAGLKKAIEVVKQGYVAEWIVDNLPGATSFVTVDKSRKYYAAGFKMGYEEPSPTTGQPRYFLNNHVTLVIRYHRAPGKAGQQGKKVIVGFEVYAKSLSAENRDHSGLPPDLHDVSRGLELTMARNMTNATSYDSSYQLSEYDDGSPDATLTIPYSYSVYFREEEKIEWANRWDLFFVNQEESQKVHWLAIVNSIVISGFLTAVVAVILTRTVKGDIRGYLDGGAHLEDGGGLLKAGGGAGKKRGMVSGLRTPRKVSGEKSSSTTGGLLEQVEIIPGSGAVTPTTTTAEDLASDDDLLPPTLDDISGWKLLHADVFRPPPSAHLLAPLIGSGVQLVTMALALLLLSCLGVLNPSYRGGFLTTAFVCFLLASVTSGYFSARLYRTFGGSRWRYNAMVTATLFPGLMFATVFVLNLFVWARASSTAIPLGTLVVLLACWLFVQVPLVYLGAWVGFDEEGSSAASSSSSSGRRSLLPNALRVGRGPYTHPLPVAAAAPSQHPPRPLPPTSRQPWFARPVPAALVAGLIPFAVIFIELLFVFRSLWQDKSGYYYVFGFLAVNYNWWWHSFLLGASSALWIFAYCLYYAANHLHLVGWTSSLLFFAYSFLACAVYALLMGTVGFLTAYAFVRRIYWAIKVD
ncbi:multispanning membrane protein, partial [Hortaea werneckii]